MAPRDGCWRLQVCLSQVDVPGGGEEGGPGDCGGTAGAGRGEDGVGGVQIGGSEVEPSAPGETQQQG